jgi:hypothetical protein
MAEYIRNERNVLDKLHHPGVAALHFTFQVRTAQHLSESITAAQDLQLEWQSGGSSNVLLKALSNPPNIKLSSSTVVVDSAS